MNATDAAPPRWPPRPTLSADFYEAHGLGNDYLVFPEGDAWRATPRAVERVCRAHEGVGSDGLVILLRDRGDGVHRLRMFNPDGGEFERSGNGLRVLGSYLVRRGDPSPYRIEVGGERILMTAHGRDGAVHDLSVEMGRARTGAAAVDLDAAALDARGRLAGPAGEPLDVVPVRVGNPHLVVVTHDVTDARLAAVGPHLVAHPALAHGANVQLARPLAGGRVEIRIWERGVGPTSASGTSACAVAVAMVSTGRVAPGPVRVEAPGGALTVTVTEDLDVVLRGPVEEVCEGRLTEGFLEVLAALG
jgi:diaminopimelate epimerase